jgi:hypothetical protein
MSVVLALLGALLTLALATAGGGLVLLRARLGFGPVDMLVRALLGLALLASFHVHPAVGLTLASLIAAATWRGHGLEDAVLEDARRPTGAVLGAILVVAVAALLRPAVPIFTSDTSIVALARAISAGDALPRADRSLVLPVITSALALGSETTTALSVAGSVFVVACFALFALLVARTAEGRFEEALPFVVLATVPLAWVHVRGLSAPLAAGLLAASMALATVCAGKGDRLGAPAAITSALLLAMVDEGAVLAIAVALALTFGRPQRDAHRAALLAVMALGLAAVAERWGAPRTRLTDVDPRATAALAREAVRHATDLQTWGVVPAIGFAALVAALRPAAREEQRLPARAIVLALAMMLVVLVVAPFELRERALTGGLLNRLGLELLPLGAVLIARSLPSRAAL